MSHTASLNEAASASDDGVTSGVTQLCPNDARLGINADAGKAKEYLLGVLCSGSNYGGAGPLGTIQHLNNGFATCAANFLKKAAGSGISICVNEGYRTPEQQNIYYQRYVNGTGGIACRKGANCEHPRGIAIDVNTNSESNYQRLHTMATTFGLTFYLGFRDKVHFVPQKGGCNSGGNLPPQETLPPGYYDFPGYSQPSPFSSVADYIRQALGGQQQQPSSFAPAAQPAQSTGSPTSVGTPTTPSQSSTQDQTSAQQQSPAPTSCTPSYSCTNGTYFYQTSSCTNLEIQKCPNGCDGDSCKLPPAGSGTQGGSSSHPTSTIDLIMAYANPTAVDIATATPIVLNQNIGDIASALGNQASQSGTMQTPLFGTVILQGTAAQQTFTSNDLAYSPGFYSSQSSTFGILENMKQALIRALNYLKPFGGISQPVYAE